MSETYLSLSSAAERLGTTTRRLRYYLDKEQVIPNRRLQAGKHKVRIIDQSDFDTINAWWAGIDGGESK